MDVCLQEIGQSDIFIGILGGEAEEYASLRASFIVICHYLALFLVTCLKHSFLKLEVEHGFLNHPSFRPSLFLFLQSRYAGKHFNCAFVYTLSWTFSPKHGCSPEKTASLKLKQRVKRASEAVLVNLLELHVVFQRLVVYMRAPRQTEHIFM